MVTSVDKYEFKLKIDEMKALVGTGNYEAAAEIAETINWRKVRNLNAMTLAGEVFEQVGRYEESKEILLMAYDKSPIGRNIIYRLAEIAIKTKNFDEAKEYYDEFVDIAPHDNLKYVLKYKMTAAQGLPFSEQIQILEELKEQEYSEEWAYELAYLYHRNGQPDKCVEACDELILWFGDGIYVEKALELKMHYQPLSRQQEQKYRTFRQRRAGVIEVKPDDFLESGEIINETVSIPSVVMNSGVYNTANLQQELKKGMEQIINAREKEDVSDAMDSIKKLVEEIPYLSLPEEDAKAAAVRQITAEIALDDEIDKQLDQSMAKILHEEPAPSAEADGEGETAGRNTHPMSIEEILADWEKTKQATRDVLREAEERKLESAKERALEEAEGLMDRLMSIMPQLTAGVTSKELLEQEYLQGTGLLDGDGTLPAENGAEENAFPEDGAEEPAGDDRENNTENGIESDIESNIEEAGRIVAGMNQLMQEQIDSLTALQTSQAGQPQEPTRELPELPPEADGAYAEAALSEAEDASAEQAAEADGEQAGDVAEEAGGNAVYNTEAQSVNANAEEIEETGEQEVDTDDSGMAEGAGYPEMDEGDVAGNQAENSLPGPQEVFRDLPQEYEETPQQAAAEEAAPDLPQTGEEAVLEHNTNDEKEETEELSEEDMASAALAGGFYETHPPEYAAPPAGIQSRKLTPEQKQIFSYFVPIAGMEAQICNLLAGVSRHLQWDKNALTGNIIIEGMEGSGKTVLTMDIIKVLQKELKRPSGKTGKINAAALNEKDIRALMEKVSGGCLIVESAGKITRETAVNLSAYMERDRSGTLYILEDTRQGVQKALDRDSSLAAKFTEKISIPVFTSDELVAFGKAYANDLDYDIDEMGILALYKRISAIQSPGHVTTLTEVKDIVDDAIDHAEKGSLKKVFGLLTSTRYNDDNYVILREKDFEEAE